MVEERMFLSDSFPCNSKPFLRRLGELLDERGTNSLMNLREDHDVRAVMWVLVAQLYGQLGVVNVEHEWEWLYDQIR